MRIVSILLMSLCVAAAQGDRFKDVQIKTIPVADGLYMLEGYGGNIAVSIGEDGVFMVDDQFAELEERIASAIAKLDDRPVQFIVNTHHHFDHTGANAEWTDRGATILAHENVRKNMVADDKSGSMLPVITYNQNAAVHFNGLDIELYHLGPGHTDGDSVVYFKGAGVVHMGDLLFNGKFPFVDLDNGGNVEAYIKSVETVLAHLPEDTKVIPGHGPLATVEDVKGNHAMLVETVGLVREGKAAGKSLEELQAAGLPDKYDGWGSGFINTDRWIETIYNDTD